MDPDPEVAPVEPQDTATVETQEVDDGPLMLTDAMCGCACQVKGEALA